MSVFAQRTLVAVRSSWPAMAVAVAGACVSAVLALMQQHGLEQLDARRHALQAEVAAQALQMRLGAYASIVQHVANRLASAPGMGQEAFGLMAQSLRVQSLPGMQALVFTRAMPGSAAMGPWDTTPDPAALPPDVRRHFVIDYLWPLAGNEAIAGLDMHGRPGLLRSMMRARDSGATVVSAPFALKQPGEHVTGIVVRAPVLAQPAPGEAGRGPAPRAFLGTADVSVRVHGLIEELHERGLLGRLALSVHDVGETDRRVDKAALPLYLGAAWPEKAQGEAAQEHGLLEQRLQVQDRIWRLQFIPRASALTLAERAQPLLLLALCLLVSGVLAALVHAWWRRRHSGWAQLRASSRSMRESDARIQALFEQAAVGVVQVEAASGAMLHVNRRCCEITGYDAQELRQRHVLTLLHSDQHEADLERLRSMALGECRQLQVERQLRHKDGRLVWVEIHVSALGRGQSMRLLALVQDISARRRLQQIQRDGSRHLRRVIQRLPLGLAMLQGDGQFAYWNEEFLRLAGWGVVPGMDGDGWWRSMCSDEPRRQRMQRRFEAAQARARVTQDRQAAGGDAAAGAINPEEYMLTGADGRSRAVALGGLLLDEGCLLILQDQSERKMAEEEIRRLAFYDALTGLPNRRLLMDRLQQALAAGRRRGRCGAVLLLDVDNFKGFNDALGLERGDALLRLIAERLLQSFGREATIARHSGDDFVVLLEDLGSDSMQAASHLEGEVHSLRTLLRQPLSVGGQPCHITLSVGVSLFSDQELTADEVLRRAEMAMYQAKGMGRNTLQFYDPQLQAVLRSRTSMEQEMRAGLSQSQFALYYQPQVSHGRIVGAEGLLRWNLRAKALFRPRSSWRWPRRRG